MLKVNHATRVVVLTGAGISAESGIRTFRDSDGLWEQHRIEDVATPEAFQRDPALVWRFYMARYLQSLEAEPNAGHKALVTLEEHTHFTLITQNVDSLHSRAGNKSVLEMHGRLSSCFCTLCRTRFILPEISFDGDLPYCQRCEGLLRPDIVWFGEVPYYLQEIQSALKKCKIFLIVGTSGVVYPAAGFVMTAKYLGAKTISVNLEKPSNHSFIDEFYPGKAGDVLPGLVQELIS
ncbi:MAG: NAD-dependent deacylase [Candidatus Cloacimonetes bacterium]|nr:NAD-dependent deacylase [Candidatus Cloacimonadota bacterium]